ncbi:hypothetical protein WJX84_005438 [Apatococcus fuscideae]|uniref:JmjC domain-containing protein n=1 Tax=Apatococcus fuscideae TaxID=2026836 RepID=A0AAW1TJW5_9CHLO
MESAPFAQQLLGPWALDRLAAAMNSKEQEWNVFCSDARRNAFLIGDLSRNVYGSHYHLQIGGPGSLLPASYQPHDRLLVQVTGRQRILLISPDQAFSGLYPYPVHHLYDGFSMVNFEKPSLDIWSGFDHVKGQLVVMSAGDVLYIPPYWFVHEQLLDGTNTALWINLAPGLRPRDPIAIPLQVSRLLEERVAAAEGVPNVRHWLQLIGHGDEEHWVDLKTVVGYRRIVLAQEVRDELDLNTDMADSWEKLLPGFVDARLLLTPWLNQNFRERLYLLDKPVRLQDDRSEEERRYPELFRQRLEGENWQVPKHVSTLPIPGYNTPAAP